ncbi:hypothetical protein D3C87_1872500 [compost metagenome]
MVSLIILAAFKMWKASVLDAATLVIAVFTVTLLLFTGIHSFFLIFGGPLAGIAVVMCKRKWGITVQTEKTRTDEKHELHFPEYYI